MRIGILLFFILILLSTNAHGQNVETFVRRQLSLYPKLHLIDIYKSCFQDFMGAEHILSDVKNAASYFNNELDHISSDGGPVHYYEYCGIKGSHVRVDLRAVKDGLIDKDVLFSAFIRSANAERPFVEEWKHLWHNMIDTIELMQLNLTDYEMEKHFIDCVLSAGKYALSHSDDYRTAYRPHYRIVQRSIFEDEIKPHLDSTRSDYILNKKFKQYDGQDHSPNIFLIMYDKDIGKTYVLQAIKDYGCDIVYDYNIINGMALKKSESNTLEETMQYFKTVKGVLSVEYDHIYHLTDPIKPQLLLK